MAGQNGYGLGHYAAAYLGRNQGPEFFTSVSHTFGGTAGAAGQILIPKNLSINRPLQALLIRWAGRLVIGTANMSAVAAEAPASIINRITINGTFKGTALTPVKIQGATAYAWARLFGLRGSSVTINGTRSAEPGVPYQQVGATLGNIGSYDVEVFYLIPTAPQIGVSNRQLNLAPYFWTPQDWSDSLQITLELGDATAIGTAGASGTGVFTAYGSASGAPTVEISTIYAILGSMRGNFRTACVVRNENVYTSGMQAIAANQRITQLQKQKTCNVIVKSGTILAGSSPGVQVFGNLIDTMIDKTQIVVDNRPIRNNLSNPASKEWAGQEFNTVIPEGYLPFSFIGSQNPRTAYRADLPTVVGAGAAFELVTDVLSAGATQQVNVIQEQIYADADDQFWGGTR
jgi:hypothetical protein